MYSPIAKYVALVVGTFCLFVAGVALAGHGIGVGFILFGVLGCLALMAYGAECRKQGAQPLTTLEPGRTYRVEGVLPEILNARGDKVARLVVSWHVDYGHWEFRMAHLPVAMFRARAPLAGDDIAVTKGARQLHYTIASAGA